MKKKVYIKNLSLSDIYVRLVNKHEILYCSNGDYYKYDKGFINLYDKSNNLIFINMSLNKNNDDYFLEESNLEIIVGKFYESVNNHKCFVYKQVADLFCYKVLDIDDDFIYAVTPDGSYNANNDTTSYDLIGEWEDDI